jgi:hypothetical protein
VIDIKNEEIETKLGKNVDLFVWYVYVLNKIELI